jgi:hypothetical protein
LVRAAALCTIAALALAACKAPPQKDKEAAASSAPASSAAAASAAPAQPAHRWAFQNGDQYGYVSSSHGEAAQGGEEEKPTIIRYLGVQDGVYAIAEVQDGAVVVAQCAPPCQQVRLRGKDLDQTLALNPDSIVHAALTDAINGQLQVYKSRSR